MKLAILFVGLLWLPCTGWLHAEDSDAQKSYDEYIQIISNYSDVNSQRTETKTISQLLEEEVGGFRLHLLWDYGESKLLYKTPKNQLEDFSEVIDLFKEFLDRNPDRILTLFLDLDLPIDSLAKVFKKKDLIKYFHKQPQDEEWPLLSDMIKKQNRLVLFSMESIYNKPDWLHYIWDYSVEPYFSLFEAPNFLGEFLKGDPKNSLLILNDFNSPSNKLDKKPVFIIDENTNHYLMNHCLNIWRNTGKVPNFIFIDLFNDRLRNIAFRLSQLKTIKGTVSYNMNLLNYVGWEDQGNCQTNGKYNFPIVPGARILLKPNAPGFSFMPESAFFEEPEESIVQNFVAVPVPITSSLVAYYSFEDEVKDESLNKHNGKSEGVIFKKDAHRGHVASFDGNEYIVLPTAEKMSIKDHNFTVSAWIKLAPNESRDNSILGTTVSSYLEGFHFTLRRGKPYFGFYSNDVQGNTNIEFDKWYHIVCRYNKLNGEQAIFVNGKLDSRSFGHPSYQGKEELIVGNAALGWPAYFHGEIDDLTIWGRCLGEEEIYNLSKEVISINPRARFWAYKRWWILAPFVFFLIALIFILRKRMIKPSDVNNKNNLRQPVGSSKNKFIKGDQKSSENGTLPKKNLIKLFGLFKVLDKDGNDITLEFTPKLKNLFLVILLHSTKTKNGITTEELSKIVWPEHTYKSAKNSRGVNMRKLRLILEQLDHAEIVFSRDRWSVELSNEVYCDYFDCLNLLENPQFNSFDYYLKLYHIIKDGQLVKNEDYEWMDDIKGYIDYRVIDVMLKYISLLDKSENADLILSIIDRIQISDPVNEKAFEIKVKILLSQDNYNYAKYTYDNFIKSYEEFYGQIFKESFEEFIGSLKV